MPRWRRRRAELIEMAWPIVMTLVGAAHLAVGVAMLLDGPAGLVLPAFRTSVQVPWWLWGSWATASGLLVLTPRPLKTIGVASTTLWYALWWALLTLGIIDAGPPHLAIFVYLLLTLLHLLLLVVEVIPPAEDLRRRSQPRGPQDPAHRRTRDHDDATAT